MAELLIMAETKSADPLSHKAGDIVDVFDNGKTQIPSAPFYRVCVPSTPISVFDEYLVSHNEVKVFSYETAYAHWMNMKKNNDPDMFDSMPMVVGSRTDTTGDWVTIQGSTMEPTIRRVYNFRFAELPFATYQKLITDRDITMSLLDFQKYLYNVVTNMSVA